MPELMEQQLSPAQTTPPQAGIKPLCPVFGECGGCHFQDISYEEELSRKQERLQTLFQETLDIGPEVFQTIHPSPQEYAYRNRLDMKLVRRRSGEILMGFSSEGKNNIIPVDHCPIAREEISAFIPELKRQVLRKLTPKYRMANLVVRSGDEKKVRWGGIGKRSLQLSHEEYFFTVVEEKKIFYSLDTFFQANLSILPGVIKTMSQFSFWNENPILFDLYGGVGLFSICFKDLAQKIYLIEEVPASIKLAYYNKNFHALLKLEIIEGKVEEKLLPLLDTPFDEMAQPKVAFIDPPRAGISPTAMEVITATKKLDYILYLSCHPDSLARDLRCMIQKGWNVLSVMPFDFFPRTKHIETLVVLQQIHP